MWDPYAEFKSITLPNGLAIHALNLPDRPFEAFGFLINSGSQQDPVGLEGLAHFTEHVVSCNAGMEKDKIEAFFNDCGGNVDLGGTNDFFTRYRFFLPTNDFSIISKAFSIFGEMLISSNIEKDIERERNVIIEEFNKKYPFYFKFEEELKERKVLYGDCWLERSTRPIGNLDSIKKISQNDLQNFYNNHYTPANIDIVCVGGMILSEIEKIVLESPFAKNKNGERTLIQNLRTDFIELSENFNIIDLSVYLNKGSLKSASYRSVARVPGYINKMSIVILDSMLCEILNNEIREKLSWTYHISSAWRDFCGFYSFSINCESFNPIAVDEINNIVSLCIESVHEKSELFEQIKKRLIAKSFMVDKTAKDICDIAMNDICWYKKIISIEEDIKDMEKIEMSDIIDLLKWLTPERRWTKIYRP